MKVVDNRKKAVEFGYIKHGEVFEYNGSFFMRTESTYCNDNGDYENYVNIENGALGFLDDDVLVMPVNSKIIIE